MKNQKTSPGTTQKPVSPTMQPAAENPTGKALAPADACGEANWIALNRLPALMWEAIRAMGESVFAPLTKTCLGDIEVIANLAGRGPHSQQAIDVVSNRLRRMTAPSQILEYSAAHMQRLTGAAYQAQAARFEEAEHTYLLVRDFMGCYIYRWPSAHTRDRLVQAGRIDELLVDRK